MYEIYLTAFHIGVGTVVIMKKSRLFLLASALIISGITASPLDLPPASSATATNLTSAINEFPQGPQCVDGGQELLWTSVGTEGVGSAACVDALAGVQRSAGPDDKHLNIFFSTKRYPSMPTRASRIGLPQGKVAGKILSCLSFSVLQLSLQLTSASQFARLGVREKGAIR